MAAYFDKLRALQANAYAPYSQFRVAALLELDDGREIAGVNVENASYGGTICAERAALVSAVAQTGRTHNIKALHLLAGASDKFVMPCGLCRQVLAELADADLPITLYNAQGQTRQVTLGELLPHAFTQADL